jgi:hypothetical protein
MNFLRRQCFGLLGLTITCFGLGLPAHALDAPKNKVLLTLSGKVGTPNQGDKAAFDLAMLKALPQKTFSTQTPWEKNPIKFSGPLLRDVLAAASAQGSTLKAVALNDYKISLPVADSQKFDVIVAHLMDDKPIPVRTKGPLFIVYPFDNQPELRSSTYYERSIWQLKAIEVE